MDINSPEFAQLLIEIIDSRIEKKFSELQQKNTGWTVAKVVTAGNGTTIQVYINNSTTAVEVKNPRGFSLTTGQLVAVVFPNFKNDNAKYIDRIL